MTRQRLAMSAQYAHEQDGEIAKTPYTAVEGYLARLFLHVQRKIGELSVPKDKLSKDEERDEDLPADDATLSRKLHQYTIPRNSLPGDMIDVVHKLRSHRLATHRSAAHKACQHTFLGKRCGQPLTFEHLTLGHSGSVGPIDVHELLRPTEDNKQLADLCQRAQARVNMCGEQAMDQATAMEAFYERLRRMAKEGKDKGAKA